MRWDDSGVSNPALKAVFDKYRHHPEFLGLELRAPNQAGAVDDTLLHLTARLGALDDMKVLIDAGADVNRLAIWEIRRCTARR